MKHIIYVTIAIALIAGCTKTHEPPIHPSDWAEPDSEYSHVAKILVTGIEDCKACHGSSEENDYYGGTSKVSCYECHAGGPSGHSAYDVWVGSPDDEKFHGSVVISESTDACKQCHSNPEGDFRGGSSGLSCYQCHAGGPSGHPAYEIWMGSPGYEKFHGRVASNKGIDTCKLCHGENLDGGSAEFSCLICHSVISF